MPKKFKKKEKVKKGIIRETRNPKTKQIIKKNGFEGVKGKVLPKVKKIDKKQLELLKKIVEAIAGINASDIVNILYGRANVNEFMIAKKLSITINQARNILYKLADEGLVSFIRKKDKKNGGWYTYFWTLDIRKSLVALQRKIFSEIENFENQLKSKKTKRFYHCSNCEMEMSEENALLHNFTCPECGEVFELKDNLGVIESLEKDIHELKDSLLFVEDEILVIEKKEEIVRLRRLKTEEKNKKIEREIKRKARARLKKKEMEEEMKTKKGKKGKVKKTKTLRKSSKSKKKKIKNKKKKSKGKKKFKKLKKRKTGKIVKKKIRVGKIFKRRKAKKRRK